MKFRFTKYGFTNLLISIIPVFPILSLYPGIIIADLIGKSVNDCETGFKITLYISAAIAVITAIIYTLLINEIVSKNEKQAESNFRIWSFILYIFLNTAGFIILLGDGTACHGDGQSILVCIISGPIASVALVVFGLIVDIKNHFTTVSAKA